jgi:hypothetical protein
MADLNNKQRTTSVVVVEECRRLIAWSEMHNLLLLRFKICCFSLLFLLLLFLEIFNGFS